MRIAIDAHSVGTKLGGNESYAVNLIESLAPEIAPFGISATIVNPGFFRTELLTEQSTRFAETTLHDYDERRAKQLEVWKWQNGKQGGDPAKLGAALVQLAAMETPPKQFFAGTDAVSGITADLEARLREVRTHTNLSVSTDGDY